MGARGELQILACMADSATQGGRETDRGRETEGLSEAHRQSRYTVARALCLSSLLPRDDHCNAFSYTYVYGHSLIGLEAVFGFVTYVYHISDGLQSRCRYGSF
jgi:hypothetical protein